MNKITHSAFNKILMIDNGESFQKMLKCRTLSELKNKLEEISNESFDYGYSDTTIEDDIKLGKYKFIGDLFEIFAESFFILFSSDNRIGIFDYKPVPSDDDNGVDGVAKNIDGDICTIQVKYRGNPVYQLKERDLKQFGYQSIVKYDIDYKKSKNMIVFTNCSGLHWHTESKVFDNRLRVINGEMISQLIDNNEGFWNSLQKLMLNSIKELEIDKLTELFEKELLNNN